MSLLDFLPPVCGSLSLQLYRKAEKPLFLHMESDPVFAEITAFFLQEFSCTQSMAVASSVLENCPGLSIARVSIGHGVLRQTIARFAVSFFSIRNSSVPFCAILSDLPSLRQCQEPKNNRCIAPRIQALSTKGPEPMEPDEAREMRTLAWAPVKMGYTLSY